MKNEDFVTYEQAKRLKELGFDWECDYLYDDDKDLTKYDYYQEFYDKQLCYNCISAPTLAQAQKWLREKGIDITPIPVTRDDERKYRWALDRLNPRLQDWTDDIINIYEQALSVGIDKALEILKEENK